MATRRGRGIYQRPNSPYWYYDVVNAAGVRRRGSTKTTNRDEAQDVALTMMGKYRAIRLGRVPDYNFAQAANRWLEEKAHKKSIGDDEQMLKWWSAKVGALPLTKLTRDLLMAYLNERKSMTSPSRANRYGAVMRSVLRICVREWGWLTAAPVLSQYPEPGGRVRYLTDSEIAALLKALPPHQRAVAIFALATGMRQSNVLNLRWDDIDMERRVAWVQSKDMKGGRPFGTVLNADAMSVLRDAVGKHAVYVFTFRGAHLSQINTPTWRNALKACGIEDFRWHDLRHTWASRLRQNGVPLDVLKELGGWKKLDMVMRYGHLSPDHLHVHQSRGAGIVAAL